MKPARRIEAVVIGGGQAGLATSRCLSDRGVDHVVLERGRVAERWHSERWDSLRLLTPNWQTRLPGFQYRGDDPDGFMRASEVAAFLEEYARVVRAPVETGTTVLRVAPTAAGFCVTTDRDRWSTRAVVIATGDSAVPYVPPFASKLPADVMQIVPSAYKRPSQLREGGVLVVGASSSGVQIADELQRAGRRVTIAAGGHTRVPRRYRGRDIMWWLDRAGFMSESIDHVQDLVRSRRQPSLQLVGHPGRESLDLALLQDRGVRITGRVAGIDGGRIALADDLVATTAASDAKLAVLMARLDEWATQSGISGEVAEPEPFVPTWPRFLDAPAAIDLRADRIRTVVWAVGYRRTYPWLIAPVFDWQGEVLHSGGVTSYPGLYILGLRFLRHRNSSFIDGVGRDAEALTGHLWEYLRWSERATA
jgi:putative flavoprotein involved in K+ transport